jgi:hypothetical protein
VAAELPGDHSLISLTYTKTASGRNAKPQPRAIEATIIADLVDQASQLSVGGRVVHRRTHRCIAFCNAVAALAGIGPVEVR